MNSRIQCIGARNNLGSAASIDRMADKFIGNLITGDHVRPKPSMPFGQKVQIGIAILVVVSLGGFLVWKFINYREERQVGQFFRDMSQGQYEQAYAMWDADEHY